MFRQLACLFIMLCLPAFCAATEPLWHVDDFQVVNGSFSAWCGSMDVISCAEIDQDGGYGANYDEILEWRGTVFDPALPCTVSVNAIINVDTMWGYDYFFISCQTSSQPLVNLLEQDGLFFDLPVSGYFVYEAGDYAGLNGDEVVIQFRVTSDGGWDGADCLWPNDGAVQLDDVSITLSNGNGYSHDFEDRSLGEFAPPLDLSDVPGATSFAVSVHPNPFNPSTSINYEVNLRSHLSVKVFDLAGRHVRTLHDGPVETSGSVIWDGHGPGGGMVPSGMYFYEVRSGSEVRVGKMSLVK